MGWVGKLWTKTMRSSNPFTRKWDEARSEGFYQIDESLATELTNAVEAAADRQELVVYIQGGQSIKVPPKPQTSGDTN
jgi:hypothetical protein